MNKFGSFVAFFMVSIGFLGLFISATNDDHVSKASEDIGMTIASLTGMSIADVVNTSISVTCTDSDGGFDRSKYGEVLLIGASSDVIPYGKDRCYDLKSGPVSYCSGSSCSQEEYYCVDINNDGAFDTYNSAVLNEICAYGCSNGACLKEPAQVSTNDNTPRIAYWWGKVNQHININTGAWETDPDGISGADLNNLTYCKKWYPDTVSVEPYRSETIAGWRNRGNLDYFTSTKWSLKCVQQNLPPCVDNDSGLNFYVKSSISGPDKDGEGNPTEDYCGDSNTLMEGYCDAGYVNFYSYPCPHGCANGACRNQSATVPNLTVYNYTDRCGDGIVGKYEQCDSGIIKLPGYVEFTLSKISNPDDTIVIEGKEYTVRLIGVELDDQRVVISVNGVNSVVSLSAPKMVSGIYVQITEIRASTAEDASISFSVKGTSIETCDQLAYDQYNFYGGDLSCTSDCKYDVSACVQQACADSDTGIDAYTYGYTKDSAGNVFKDRCDGNVLSEQFCGEGFDGHETTRVTLINCTSCRNGACVLENATVHSGCYDSDGGIDQDLKGYIEGTYPDATAQYNYSNEDFCYVDDNATLVEFFCNSEGFIDGNKYICPNGCRNGACIQKLDYDLGDFPRPFLDDSNNPDVIFVVGKKALVDDVIGLTDITTGLQNFAVGILFPVGIVRFDSEISDEDLFNSNLIIVGGKCANTAVGRILGAGPSCDHEDRKGVGTIELIHNKNEKNYVLLIHGFDAQDTTRATRVIANWQTYHAQLDGQTKVCVTGTLAAPTVKPC